MVALTQDGFPANVRSLVASQQVPGTTVKLTVRIDAPGLLLLEVASAFDRLVEDIDNGRGALDDWGYAERPIRGGSETSNHAGGVAVDLNAVKHPLGVPAAKTFSKAQIDACHKIIAACGGVVRWGGDYDNPAYGGVRGSRPDSMHWEINDGQSVASCQRALVAMRAFNHQEDELSAQFEAEARSRWPKEDLLDKDTRGDLHAKQLQLDRIEQKLDELLKEKSA